MKSINILYIRFSENLSKIALHKLKNIKSMFTNLSQHTIHLFLRLTIKIINTLIFHSQALYLVIHLHQPPNLYIYFFLLKGYEKELFRNFFLLFILSQKRNYRYKKRCQNIHKKEANKKSLLSLMMIPIKKA